MSLFKHDGSATDRAGMPMQYLTSAALEKAPQQWAEK